MHRKTTLRVFVKVSISREATANVSSMLRIHEYIYIYIYIYTLMVVLMKKTKTDKHFKNLLLVQLAQNCLSHSLQIFIEQHEAQ